MIRRLSCFSHCAIAVLIAWASPCQSARADGPPSAQPAKDGVVINEVPPTGDAKMAGCADSGCGVDWSKIPPVRIIPRTGNFPIPPSGAGYYSLLDMIFGEYREKPPRFPYAPFALMQPPFYEVDWRYLDDPKNTQHDFFDPLHRIHFGDNFLFNTGGQTSVRYMHELDSRLSGKDNDYELYRARIYGDMWYQDRLRVYAEFITAQSFNQDLPPLIIDRNYADLLDLFADVKIADVNGYPAYLRIGRQEMNIGSQRLISSPVWANTRRTFDGVRMFREGEKFDVDFFWVSPVKPDNRKFDSHDNNQNFAGAWFTYRPEKGTFLDAYYLFLDNTNNTTAKVGKAEFPLVLAPFNVHTLGTRYCGDKNNFLWDVEAMLQLGERGNEDTTAGAATVGGGYHFKSAPMNPTVWVYYDYASGDRSPNANDFNTFNQLFPFGHYYFGFMDFVGRQNIQDLNCHVYLYPTKWITFNAQWHHFRLDSANDALYNFAGTPLRISPTGTASKDVGHELDLLANFHLGAHSDVLVGWSKLWAGAFIRNTGSDRDPELLYLMYNFRW